MLWFRVPARLFKEIGEDDISGAAAELAYKLFLALFPFLIFLAAMGSFASDLLSIQNPTEEIMDSIGTSLPPDAESVLRTELSAVLEQRDARLLTIGILGSVWAASSGIGTVMKTLNRVNEVEETRPLWKRYGIALGLTFTAGTFLIGSVLIALVGETSGLEIASRLGLEGSAATLFTLARWPVIVVLLLTAIAVLLWATPNTRLPFRWISPGAVMFVVVWIPATALFSVYVSNFGSYNATYGTLGGAVALMVWLYLTSFVLLMAAELNDVLIREKAPAAVKAKAGHDMAHAHASSHAGNHHGSKGPLDRVTARLPEIAVVSPVVVALLLRRRRPAAHAPTRSGLNPR